MTLKCRYFEKTPYLTDSHEKRAETYNEWNDKCPLNKIILSEISHSEKSTCPD